MGEVGKNNSGTLMRIIEYRSSEDVDIEFLDEHHYIKKHSQYCNFKKGQIKNPYDKDLYGVGYIGVGKWKVKDETGKWSRVYLCWRHMIERCYFEKNKDLHKAYYGICEVCDEWLNFQNFACWYKSKEYDVPERLHLDKDIKYPGNTLYSPETCILVPQKINMMFMNKANKRGLPNGITQVAKGYHVKYNGEKLGVYPTVEEAYLHQTKKKKEEIIKLANEYKEIIPNYIYDIVVSYEFDIKNDKNYMKQND